MISRRAALGVGLGVAAAGLVGLGAEALHDESNPILVTEPSLIEQAQQALTAQGFWCGSAGREITPLFTCAVLAFQKEHGRRQTGVLDRTTLAALHRSEPVRCRSRRGTVIEVDLRRQVLRVASDGSAVAVLHASSGAGLSGTFHGFHVDCRTPRGRFRIGGDQEGVVRNDLGPQYRPHFFLADYALHGRNDLSTVRRPSTSGGVAVPREAIDFLAAEGHLARDREVWIA